MKKLLFILAFFGFIFSSNAQKGIIGLAIGLKGEGTVINIKDNLDNTDYKLGLGYGFGGFVRLKIFKLYIQPELNYSYQSLKYNDQSLNKDYKLSYSAVDIPVLLGLYLFKVDNVALRLFIGPELTVLGSYKLDDTTVDKAKSGIRSGFGSLTGGVGVDIGRLTIDARYKSAFTSLSSISNVDLLPKQVILSVGIKIHHREGL